jgi:hypothetical protein
VGDLGFTELVFEHVGEEVAAAAVFHYKVEVFFILISFIKLYDIWVV